MMSVLGFSFHLLCPPLLQARHTTVKIKKKRPLVVCPFSCFQIGVRTSRGVASRDSVFQVKGEKAVDC